MDRVGGWGLSCALAVGIELCTCQTVWGEVFALTWNMPVLDCWLIRFVFLKAVCQFDQEPTFSFPARAHLPGSCPPPLS